jgi:hypothetical protein
MPASKPSENPSQPTVTIHDLVDLGIELGLAVNDYNSHIKQSVDDIVRLTIVYVTKVKEAVICNVIAEAEVPDYFALVGKVWSAVDGGVYSG